MSLIKKKHVCNTELICNRNIEKDQKEKIGHIWEFGIVMWPKIDCTLKWNSCDSFLDT